MTEEINSIFTLHPGENEVYTTTDGYHFFKLNFALSHSQKLEDVTITVTMRNGESFEYDPLDPVDFTHSAYDQEVADEEAELVEIKAKAIAKAKEDAAKQAAEEEAAAAEEPAQEEPAQEAEEPKKTKSNSKTKK